MSWPPTRARKNIGGTYAWRDGKCVKVSNQVHTFHDAYVPEGGYVDESLGHSVEDAQGNSHWMPAHITSRAQKAQLMKEQGVVEDGGFKKPTNRMYFT